MPRKIVIDVDTGVDDAHAIMLALSSPDVEVLAITCVAGNVGIDKIPVYRGAAAALTSEGITASHYHGNDGLGDTDLQIDIPEGLLQPVHATRGLIDLVYKYPGEITLVALAPLTNVALAMKVEPEFGSRLKNVTIMGGNIEGTIKLSKHFRFLKEWFDRWIQVDTVKGRFLKEISSKTAHVQREIRKLPIFRSCDMGAMVTVVDHETITESVDVYATVETRGQFTRGMMVVDWRGIFKKTNNVTIVKRIDTERARKIYDNIVVD